MKLLNKLLIRLGITHDKDKHFVVGVAFGVLTLPFLYFINLLAVFAVSLVFSSVFFFGKEVYDKNRTGFDIADIKADYQGWGFGVGIALFIYIISNSLF